MLPILNSSFVVLPTKLSFVSRRCHRLQLAQCTFSSIDFRLCFENDSYAVRVAINGAGASTLVGKGSYRGFAGKANPLACVRVRRRMHLFGNETTAAQKRHMCAWEALWFVISLFWPKHKALSLRPVHGHTRQNRLWELRTLFYIYFL